ncbi:MAG: T9SS type A sorting domain-containing protein [Aequorivita sp.]
MKRLLLFSILSIFCLTISAQTKTWVGPSGGSFNVAANWNPSGIPSSAHDVIIPAGSNILLDGASIKSITTQGNVTVAIAGQLNISSPSSISSNTMVTWNSGGISGNGTLTNNGTINMTTAASKGLGNTFTLKNNGTFDINYPGNFTLGYGSPTLNNAASGIININTAGSFTYTQGVGTVINAGTINKKQDGGTYNILSNFTNNNGTISVTEGTLKLDNSNAALTDGIYNVTAGNILELASTIKLLGTLTGQLDGQINWIGTLNVDASTEAIFDFSGPTGVNWSSGSLGGNGTLTNMGKINFIGASTKNVKGSSTLKNEGTFNIDSASDFVLGYGAPTFNNTSSGIININSAGELTYTQGYGTLVNSGFINKTQDDGLYQIYSNFTNNDGTISITNGALKLNNSNALLNDGIYNVTAGNTLEWASTIKLLGTLNGQLDGQINWSGTLNVEATTEAIFNFTGSTGVNWTSGRFGGDGTLKNQSTLNLVSENSKSILGQSLLNNEGIINYNSTGALVLGFGSGTLSNASSGVINLNSNSSITYTQGYGTFINNGLLQREQSSGIFEINSKFENNDGSISVEAGTLKLNHSNALLTDGVYNVSTGSTLEWTNGFTLLGTLTGQLDGQINWNGSLKVEPSTEAILDFSGPSGVNWTSGGFGGNGIGTLINKGILNLVSESGKSVGGQNILKNKGIINHNGTGSLTLGYGSPTLNNTSSGIINLNEDSSITYSQGVGTLVNTGIIKKEQSTGTFSISANTNNISPGKLICENGLLAFGTYVGNGLIGGNGSVQLPNNTTFEGTIAPGSSPGTLTFTSNYNSAPATILEMELNGPIAGTEYDVFAVQGNAIMDGNILVELTYEANLNDEFVILTSPNITSCNLPSTVNSNYDNHDYTFDVICNPTNVILKVSNIVLGTDENSLNNLAMYPNPSKGYFTIDLGREYSNVNVEIYNMLGQPISSEKYPSVKIIKKEITSAAGVYFVRVSNAAEESKTLRIIKQ